MKAETCSGIAWFRYSLFDYTVTEFDLLEIRVKVLVPPDARPEAHSLAFQTCYSPLTYNLTLRIWSIYGVSGGKKKKKGYLCHFDLFLSYSRFARHCVSLFVSLKESFVLLCLLCV